MHLLRYVLLVVSLLFGLVTAAPAVASPTEGPRLVPTNVPDGSISSADAETILTTPNLGLSKPYPVPIGYVVEDQTPANETEVKSQNAHNQVWLYYCKHPYMQFCYHRWAEHLMCYRLTFFNNVISSYWVNEGCCTFYSDSSCQWQFKMFEACDRGDERIKKSEDDKISSIMCHPKSFER
ncbi:hypothetical protein BZA77DRAFT_297995 [Pyronema omphalodes]|nr:hypothetical protein BZA77DRAFT_297995 [Pyronema omphalodes]